MTKKYKIAVIGGGYSAEREISLKSAHNVFDSIDADKYNKVFIDLVGEPESEFIDSLKDCDLILPILHGRGGEDGTLQKMLDEAGLKYLGTGEDASKVAFNKYLAKKKLTEGGILMPEGGLVNPNNVDDFIKNHKEFILKPIDEGSSVGLYISRGGKIDHQKISNLLEVYGEMVGEELVKGTEITVPILQSSALPVVAIFPPANEEFDLINKYNGLTKEVCPIPDEILPQQTQKKAMYIAEKAHKLIGARHLSRVDFIVTPNSEIYLLEINTMPGLTKESLYPKSARAAGYDMNGLTDKLIEISLDNI